jgi:hypothetical protein
VTILAVGLVAFVAFPAAAQQEEKPGGDAAEANNPLANMKAFNLQNYYIPELSELDDENANYFWLRYAQPLGKWLTRASLPIIRGPVGPDETSSGLGDLNIFSAYLFDMKKPGLNFGVGPQVTLPTGESDFTADKYQLGLAAVLFDASSPKIQWGGLVTWQTDVGGSGNASDTSFLAVQPFYFFQLGKGRYIRGAPIWAFDLENDSYNVPVGLGVGQVMIHGDTVFNFFIEPQFTILDRGPAQPELQILVAVNMQFKG